MAGLLAWAADVVGGGGNHSDEEDNRSSYSSSGTLKFTPQQQEHMKRLDERASKLRKSIDQLRQRIPPADVSQRLPHLLAHSVASNAALALQVNAHTATRQQAQLRETSLVEENAAYEKAISLGKKQIEEKVEEKKILESKLEEIESSEESLKAQLEKLRAEWEKKRTDETSNVPITGEAIQESAPANMEIYHELENKKTELHTLEEKVQHLEERWETVQRESIRKPSPAQREKILEKQLHSMLEQLAAKHAQAEDLATEIHARKLQLDRLNGMRSSVADSISLDTNAARNRTNRPGSMNIPISGSTRGNSGPSDKIHNGNFARDAVYTIAGILDSLLPRNRNQRKRTLILLGLVLYILTLHLLVLFKISSAILGRKS